MRIAVFDCPLGIAGDMTLGALLDAGMPFRLLESEIAKLGLKGYRLGLAARQCGAFRAKKFLVRLDRHPRHHHTPFSEVRGRIARSRLAAPVKRLATAIFRNLARAEGRVHGIAPRRVHFHEVGAIDSFIDIVGTAVCFHHLGIRKAYVRQISVGRGVQQGEHRRMPIPVPGAYELLKGFFLTQRDYEHEMVTPTGAAILATVCEKTTKTPRFKPVAIGYGAGDRKFDGEYGLLRITLGETR